MCLIGVRPFNTSKVLLNPGSSYLMDDNDICFYIAMSSEEESAFKDINKSESKDQSSTGNFSVHSNNAATELQRLRSIGTGTVHL